ncbi:MAG: DUF1648 domain-containing protein [[Clostridium] nexile]
MTVLPIVIGLLLWNRLPDTIATHLRLTMSQMGGAVSHYCFGYSNYFDSTSLGSSDNFVK